MIAIVTRQRSRPSALLHTINRQTSPATIPLPTDSNRVRSPCHSPYDQGLGFGCPAGEPEHMGFPATRKPCDIALQGQTLLVFVFGITPPPHRPDAAVKAELIPTRPSASACTSVVSTPSSRSCVSSPKQ